MTPMITDLSPKLNLALSLTMDFVREGRAVLVFSPLLPPLRTLSRALNVAGIPHHVLDGTVAPEDRARKAAEFMGAPRSTTEDTEREDGVHTSRSVSSVKSAARVPVLLAGQDCMGEGYNFPHCHRIIMLASGWALDKCLQAEERGWRLDSAEDLHVYRLITDGTIDERMESMQDDKLEGADAVLDGVW